MLEQLIARQYLGGSDTTIATARIVMPRTMVRLSAGRLQMSELDQTMMFMAGANSIFTGDKLLTTANPEMDKDEALFRSEEHTSELQSP